MSILRPPLAVLDESSPTPLVETKKQCLDATCDQLVTDVNLRNVFFNPAAATEPYSRDALTRDITSEELGIPYQTQSFLRDVPVHLKRLCEYKLLSATAECDLFHRLNACKFYLRQMSAQPAPTVSLEDAEQFRLLEATYYRLRAVIIRSNTRLVIATVKTFTTPSFSFDSLLSIGIESLVENIDNFNVLLGYRFSTYLCTILRRQCAREIAKHNRRQLRFRSNADDIFTSARCPDIGQSPLTEQASDALQATLATLDERTSHILRHRFGLQDIPRATLETLANELRLSKERIRQIEKQGLETLRQMILHGDTQIDTSSLAKALA